MSIIIKELRDRTGLSQSKFAKQFNIPVSTLRKWEQAESDPADYLVELLARTIPADTKKLEKIVCNDGTVFYYDKAASMLIDSIGNRIAISENLEGVKRLNLPLYVQDLFASFYEIQEKFNSDCRYDKKEDIIWS